MGELAAKDMLPNAAQSFLNVYLKRVANKPPSDDEIMEIGGWMRTITDVLLQDRGAEIPALDESLHPHQHAEIVESVA